MVFCAAAFPFPAPLDGHGLRLVRPARRMQQWLLALMLMVITLGTAFAESIPPSRVGRIGFIEGDVSFFADREDGWRKARLNYPVTSRNSVWSNGPGKAEVKIGASAIRIDADSMLDFVRVDDAFTELFLQRGRVNIRLRGDNQNDGERESFRVDTSEGSIALDSNGRYRIDAAQERNETRVSVFVGRARFDNGSAQLTVDAGRTLIIRGSSTPSFSFDVAAETAFDRWAETRDQRWDDTHRRYANERFISPNMTGYEDLDANGDWIEDREYGRLWAPRVVAAGWVPYRYGSWSYVRPWGWTWIDDAPWGFAPFHYGRWVQVRARWCWWPGGYRHRPVYAPALVAWEGGSNVGISVNIGTPIGWFPLAPREQYVPRYSNNITYIRNINNITNNITVVNRPTHYINQSTGGTVVNNRVVVNGEPVWRHATISDEHGNRRVKPMVDPHGQNPTAQPTWVVGDPPAPPPRSAPNASRPTAVTGEPVRSPSWAVGETPRGVRETPGTLSTATPAVPSRPPTGAVPATTLTPATIEEPLPMARPIKPNPRPAPPAPTAPATPTYPSAPATLNYPSAPAPLAYPSAPTRQDGAPSVTTKPSVLRESGAVPPAVSGEPPRMRESTGRLDRSDRTERPERIEQPGRNPRIERAEVQGRVETQGRAEGGAVQQKPAELKEKKPAEPGERRHPREDGQANAGGKVGQVRAEERNPKVAPQ